MSLGEGDLSAESIPQLTSIDEQFQDRVAAEQRSEQPDQGNPSLILNPPMGFPGGWLNRPGYPGDSFSWEIMEYGKTDHVFTRGTGAGGSLGVRAPGEHRSEWAAICSIAEKFGCSSETLRKWVRQAERDQGVRPGLSSDERTELGELRREVRELRRANEILRKASAYFAQAELDRRPRR